MHWHSWSPVAFREAVETGRPILLYLTTAWSRGCREMERAALVDPRVTALIEQAFVAIRVDADERPDIAERYTLGGWPSTVLLSADGDILQGGTYFDAEGLRNLLARTSAAYRDQRAAIARRAAEHAAATASPSAGRTDADADVAGAIRTFLLSRSDPEGGFTGAPKFLHEDGVLLLLRDGSTDTTRAARATLTRAARALIGPSGEAYRCAMGPRWDAVLPEVTPESQAAAVRLFTEAVSRFQGEFAAELRVSTGFAHRTWIEPAQVTLYTDAAANLASAVLVAAQIMDEPSLGRDALALLERSALSTYYPGRALRHSSEGAAPSLLGDHVWTIAALLDAHDATGELPYSMLAEELGHRLLEMFLDASRGALRDRVHDAADLARLREPMYPYRLNAHAARAFGRLAAVSGEPRFADAAAHLFEDCAARWPTHGLDAAACGLAAVDLIDWRHP